MKHGATAMAPAGVPPPLKLSLFDRQKIRGAGTSLCSGILANGSYWLLWKTVGLNPVLAAVLGTQVIGGFLSYMLDILFAKENFMGRPVPYSHLGERTQFLIQSLGTEMILRFIIATIIMTVVFTFAFQAVLKMVERHRLKFKYYEAVYGLLLAMGLYFLFNHALLFDYVYNESTRSIAIDITAIGIMVLCLIMLSIWYISQPLRDELSSTASTMVVNHPVLIQ